ncbi:hypothetical protein [Pseudonocardia sp. TRM90224]|nr:hypothetical protein [Pseudonocardia sp. TRM90224]
MTAGRRWALLARFATRRAERARAGQAELERGFAPAVSGLRGAV